MYNISEDSDSKSTDSETTYIIKVRKDCSNHLSEKMTKMDNSPSPGRPGNPRIKLGTKVNFNNSRKDLNINSFNKIQLDSADSSQIFSTSPDSKSDVLYTAETHCIRVAWRKFIKKVRTAFHNTIVCADFNYRRPDLISEDDEYICFMCLKPKSNDVPGIVGLQNHGNTCFINAIVQCLSQTNSFAKYFVTNQYKLDIETSKLISRKCNTFGGVTEQLSLLLKSIWHGLYDPIISYQFKLAVSKYGAEYRDYGQHDALEFLIWLLNKLHEDLNLEPELNKVINKISLGQLHEGPNKQTLQNHYFSKSSFIQTTFQGQFRSSLTCLNCKFQSISFDPFLHVSVPIPRNNKRPVFVIVLYISQQPRQVKLALSLHKDSKINDLRKQLSCATGIPKSCMLLTQIGAFGFLRTFSGHQPIREIEGTDPTYCIEMPELKSIAEETEENICLCWINVTVTAEGQRLRFGSPYTTQLPRFSYYRDIQKLLLNKMNEILHKDAVMEEDVLPFQIKIAEDVSIKSNTSYLDATVDSPLYTDEVDQVLALQNEDSGPKHLKLILEWDASAKKSFIANDGVIIEEDRSAKRLLNNPKHKDPVTIEECFRVFTKSEILRKEDKWECAHCNTKQEVIKKLELWSLPDILVVHLKRFQQSSKNGSSTKLMAPVAFPTHSLDMNLHLVDKFCDRANDVDFETYSSRSVKAAPYDENVYDLYAVCNHHGQHLYSGHYTAFCRSPYNGQWYWLDDERVLPVDEKNVVTNSAYVLFYQRKNLVRGSREWLDKMPIFYYGGRSSEWKECIKNEKRDGT